MSPEQERWLEQLKSQPLDIAGNSNVILPLLAMVDSLFEELKTERAEVELKQACIDGMRINADSLLAMVDELVKSRNRAIEHSTEMESKYWQVETENFSLRTQVEKANANWGDAEDRVGSALVKLAKAEAQVEQLREALKLVEFGSCDGCGSRRICAWCSSGNVDCEGSEYFIATRAHKPSCPVAAALDAGGDG